MTAPQPAGRITAPLIGEAVIALCNTAETLGLTRTDTINRALQAYAYLTAVQQQGGGIYIRERPGDRLNRIILNSPEES